MPGLALPRADAGGVPEPALAALGLGRTAERVYRALLAHGPAAPERLADVARTDLVTVAAALAELAELDLAHPGTAAQPCWSAESPELALAALVVRRQGSLLERQRDLERAQRAVSELVQRSRTAVGRAETESVEVLAGADRIRHRAQHVATTARQEVLTLDPAPFGAWSAVVDEPGPPAASGADLRDLVRRGVHVRAVYERAGLLARGRFDAVRRRAAAGEDTRTVAALPLRLVAADRNAAVVQLDVDAAEPTALVVPPSALLAGLLLLFDTLWERAAPLPATPGARADDRGAEFDDVLVALLAAGFKDESIARHLGISTSTVTRRMARLMERTGASTRFQLGMQAVRRRWI